MKEGDKEETEKEALSQPCTVLGPGFSNRKTESPSLTELMV